MSAEPVPPSATPAPRRVPAARAAGAAPSSVQERALVARHTELVKRIAYHLAARLPPSVEVDDLIQAGLIGLLDAARHYDGGSGASFETYAGIRIRGAMVDELRACDWAPRSVHRKVREAAEAMRKLEQEYGHAARESDVAARLGIGVDDYRAIQQDAVQCQMLSLDAPLDDDEAGGGSGSAATAQEARQRPDLASIAPQEHLQDAEFQAALAAAIRRLPDKEQLVLSLYYKEELNLREIGEVISVTESRVCQIHGQALLRLRSLLGEWTGAAAPAAKSRRSRNAAP